MTNALFPVRVRYPWYTDVRKTLEDPAYHDWYFKFKVRASCGAPVCWVYGTDSGAGVASGAMVLRQMR